MIIALAGRRIDAVNATPPRFPAENAVQEKQRITEFLQAHQATALVCAAACGADTLALEAARELGLRRRVVLPFESARFRAMSVVERGGDWGARYDQIIAEVSAKGELIEKTLDPENGHSNVDILDQTQALTTETGSDAAALIVSSGVPRGDDDVTDPFKTAANARGFGLAEIFTL